MTRFASVLLVSVGCLPLVTADAVHALASEGSGAQETAAKASEEPSSKSGTATEISGIAACKQANEDFEFDKAVLLCTGALEQGTLGITEQIDAYRLLGVAEASLNHEKKARQWFLKLLVLDSAHELGAGASPVFRQTLEKAREKLLKKGPVDASMKLLIDSEGPGPWLATVTLTDPLNRVKSGAVVVRAIRNGAEIGRSVTPLTRREDQLQGSVEDPAPSNVEGVYQLETQLTVNDAAGNAITLANATAPATFARAGGASEALNSTTWIGVGGGAAAAAAAAVVIGGGIAAVAGCLISGLCVGGDQDESSHIRVGPAL